MTVYTSWFGGPYADHPNAFAISRTVPPEWRGKRCEILAPPMALVDLYKRGLVSWKAYTEIYNWYVQTLSMETILWNLEQECPEEGAPDIYLLCWEPPGKKCHRRLAAAEMEKQLSITVREA